MLVNTVMFIQIQTLKAILRFKTLNLKPLNLKEWLQTNQYYAVMLRLSFKPGCYGRGIGKSFIFDKICLE